MNRRGFTLIELLVVVAIIVALLAIMMPSLNKAMDVSMAAVCMSNLRQQSIAISSYQADKFGVYPDHRWDNFGAGSRPDGYDKYWASTLLDYGTKPNLYRCPPAGTQRDHGFTWTWAFNQHFIGYGYNGWFLGLRLYADQSYAGISTHGNLRLSEVRNPAMNITIADSAPRGSGVWSQSVWWPNSGSNDDEGMVDSRHRAGGGTVWGDGHAELRKADTVNPNGPALTLDKIKLWDPKLGQP